MGLYTPASVLHGHKVWQPAGKEFFLDVFGNLHFERQTALDFTSLFGGTLLGIQEVHQPGRLKQVEFITINIFERRLNPCGHRYGHLAEANSTR